MHGDLEDWNNDMSYKFCTAEYEVPQHAAQALTTTNMPKLI